MKKKKKIKFSNLVIYSFEDFFNKRKIIKRIRPSIIIIGRILQIKAGYVIVDCNLKSEGFIPISEFRKPNGVLEVSTGNYIELFLKSIDNGKGVPILSRLKLKHIIVWRYLKNILLKKKHIIGYIIGKIKGGFSVMIGDVKCFLPFSNTDKRVLFNISYYENKELYFRIINIDVKKKNVVLSRKLVLKKILRGKKKNFMNIIKTGFIVYGVIKNITSYGVFVDMGYMDGIVLTKNVTWGPYKYSNEILTIGQSIKARVLKINRLKNRIFLGIKQLIKDPWDNIHFKYKIGSIGFCRINMIKNNSINVILEKGVFGVIKMSNFLKKFYNKKGIIKINNYIKVIIISIDKSKRFLELEFYP